MPSLAGAITRLGLLALPAIPSPTYFAAKATTDTWSLSIADSSALAIVSAVAVTDAWSLTYTVESGLVTVAAQIAGTDTWSASLADAGALTKSPHEKTQLSLLALPGKYVAVTAKSVTSTQDVPASDTWSLSWNDDPTSDVQFDTWDAWALTAVESVGLVISQTFAANDGWSLNWQDIGSVFSGAPVDVSRTDTWSLTFTDAATVAATVGASADTWSIQITDSGSVVVTQDAKAGTDTWSLAFALETGFFTPVVEIPILGSDEWRLIFAEVSNLVPLSGDNSARLVLMRAVNRIVRMK